MAYGIDLWKIVLESDCSEETKNQIRIGLDDLNAKAKAFDEIKEFITRKLKEEETTDEYDYGERFMCEEIKRLWEGE